MQKQKQIAVNNLLAAGKTLAQAMVIVTAAEDMLRRGKVETFSEGLRDAKSRGE